MIAETFVKAGDQRQLGRDLRLHATRGCLSQQRGREPVQLIVGLAELEGDISRPLRIGAGCQMPHPNTSITHRLNQASSTRTDDSAQSVVGPLSDVFSQVG